MGERGRWALFAILLLGCSVAAVATVVSSLGEREPEAGASERVRDVLASGEGRPLVVLRATEADPRRSGRVAVASVGGDGPRTPAPLRCDRVYFAAGTGLCLAPGTGFAAGYRARIFGADFRVRGEVEVAGIPSRARVSPDGRYGSVTLFVSGHSYTAQGAFSTQTTLIDLEQGERIAELEQFTVTRAGRQVTAVDVNFWGVTFARDSDRFYATMATGGKTYLIQGSVSRRSARVLRENVECPSLSPDGTRIAYKRRTGSAKRPWQLAVLDLDTMRETPLAEARSVDDQAEWLDDDEVLYGLDGDVWAVLADGSGRPRRFARGAGSPAVVRG